MSKLTQRVHKEGGHIRQTYSVDGVDIVDINWGTGEVTIDSHGHYKDPRKDVSTIAIINTIITHFDACIFLNKEWQLQHTNGEFIPFADGMSFNYNTNSD